MKFLKQIRRKLRERMPHLFELYFFFKYDKTASVFDLIAYRNGPRGIFLENRGTENPEHDIYLILLPTGWRAGFFASFNATLTHLCFADRFNLIPVVEYASDSLYESTLKEFEGVNVFEQFFMPVSSISILSAHNSQSVMQARIGIDGTDRLSLAYGMSESGISQCAEMYRKYIHIRPALELQLQNDIANILKKKRTLAIHVRGTDFNLNEPGHPIPVSLEQYLERAMDLMQLNKFEQIFLATDEEATVTAFQKEFGDKLVYYKDVRRSTKGNAIHIPAPNITVERENDKYLIGVEVLRDALTLADCDALLAGYSQVSWAALIMKKAKKENYSVCTILSNGLNPV